MYNTYKKSHCIILCTIWVDIGHVWTPWHPLEQTVLTGWLLLTPLPLPPTHTGASWFADSPSHSLLLCLPGEHGPRSLSHVLSPMASSLPQERVPRRRLTTHLGGLLDELWHNLFPSLHLYRHHGYVRSEGYGQKHEYQWANGLFQYTQSVYAQGHGDEPSKRVLAQVQSDLWSQLQTLSNHDSGILGKKGQPKADLWGVQWTCRLSQNWVCCEEGRCLLNVISMCVLLLCVCVCVVFHNIILLFFRFVDCFSKKVSMNTSTSAT